MSKYKVGQHIELSPETKSCTALQGVVINMFTAPIHSQAYFESNEEYEARREVKTTYLIQLDPILIKSDAL